MKSWVQTKFSLVTLCNHFLGMQVTGCCGHHVLRTKFSPDSSAGNNFILILSGLLNNSVKFCMEYSLCLSDTELRELEFSCQEQ